MIDLCKMQSSRKIFDCENNEFDAIVQYLNKYQEFKFECKNTNCNRFLIPIHEKRNQLYCDKDENENFVLNHNNIICSECLNVLSIEFYQTPPWLVVQTLRPNEIMLYNDLPKTLSFNNKTYIHLCSTIYKAFSRHFCAIFEINNRYFFVDDLSTNCIENIPDIHYSSTSFYYLSD